MRSLAVGIISAAMLSFAVIGISQTSEPTPLTEPTPLSLPPTPTPAAVAAVDAGKAQAEIAANVKELEQLKAQNDEILKQQQAALDTLEQLEKDADQIKIFSKRG